eukprot:5500898-Prymnesium_polylepis.1
MALATAERRKDERSMARRLRSSPKEGGSEAQRRADQWQVTWPTGVGEVGLLYSSLDRTSNVQNTTMTHHFSAAQHLMCASRSCPRLPCGRLIHSRVCATPRSAGFSRGVTVHHLHIRHMPYDRAKVYSHCCAHGTRRAQRGASGVHLWPDNS